MGWRDVGQRRGLESRWLAFPGVVGQAKGMQRPILATVFACSLATFGCDEKPPTGAPEANTATSAGPASASSVATSDDAPRPDRVAGAPPGEESVADRGEAGSPSPGAKSAPAFAPPTPLDQERVRRMVGALDSWAKKHGGSLGAAVLDLQDDRLLASAEADRAVNPASNQKVLTAAAALHYLGPGYRFRTELAGRIRDGQADPLVLRGNGDPSSTTADLWRLAHVAKDQGLTRVGTILVDQSHFDDKFVPPAFEQQPDEWASFRAPVSAVALDGNSVTLNVDPTEEGKPARFWFEPPGSVDSKGTIQTKAGSTGDRVQWSLGPDGPGGASLLASKVGGSIGEGLGRRRYPRRLDDPRLVPGFALRTLLQEMGVEVSGAVRLGGESVRTSIAYLRSEPLSQLLYPLGKNSDNFYAETLLKAIGAEQAKGSGTSAAGAQALVKWLERNDISTQGVVIKNGSGLFDANRLSPQVLVRTLAAAYREPASRSEMIAQLAIGGVDGTLERRFSKLKSTRSVRAKTGTLRDVIALSGYVLAPGQRAPVAFSFLVVGVEGRHGETRRKVDAVVESIAALLGY